MSKNRCAPFMPGWPQPTSDEEDMWPSVTHTEDWKDRLPEVVAAMQLVLQDSITAARYGVLEQRIQVLEDAQLRHENLTSLVPSKLRLIKNIPISIAFNGDDYVATFFDAKISATGDTAAEALWNIRDILVLKFTRLSELPQSSLGPMPRQQLAVLREFIEE